MRAYLRLVRVGCAAILALALLAGGASASRSLTVNRTAIRAVARTAIFNGLEVNTTCEVTLNGETTVTSFAKRSGLQFGVITEGRSANCRGAARRVVFLNTPANAMRLAYSFFAGALPSITSVRASGSNFLFELQETFVGNCLYRVDSGSWNFFATSGRQEYDRVDTRIESTLFRGGIFCPRATFVSAVFTVSPLLNVGLI